MQESAQLSKDIAVHIWDVLCITIETNLHRPMGSSESNKSQKINFDSLVNDFHLIVN